MLENDATYSRRTLAAINVAVFAAALSYGTTFPLFALRLEAMGVSGAMIGLNASMPALGWVLGSLAAPSLQAKFSIRTIACAFLCIGLAALAGLAISTDFWSSTGLRLFFGGGAGMFFRSIEYWINGISSNNRRGRNFATYNVIYVLGLVIGTLIQPQVGTDGLIAFGPVAAGFAGAALLIAVWPRMVAPERTSAGLNIASISALTVAPGAFLAIFAYGLYEDIPIYLMPVYALRNGLAPDVSAYALTACCVGNLIFPIPMAALSDRIGRTTVLIACAVVVIGMSAVIPFTLATPMAFLASLVVWAGCAGATYSVALAKLGDEYQDGALVTANASFGIVYASGTLAGPLINGASMDALNSHGVMASAAAIFSVLIVMLAALAVRPGRREAA